MQRSLVVENRVHHRNALLPSKALLPSSIAPSSTRQRSINRNGSGSITTLPMASLISSSTLTPSRPVCCSSSSSPSSATTSAPPPPVKAVLFDMDGVLCNSEIVSRKAAAEVMQVLYDITVSPDEFKPYTGTGEANFLGGVARKFGAPFEVESCKAKFFEIYMEKYATPGAGIGEKGAKELVAACRAAGLKTAVASSADLVKVHANLGAADIPLELFDAVVSADVFERLKPFPDIFLAAAAQVGVDPANCVVIEDAVAGVEAARAAGMRVIGVTTTLGEDEMAAAAPDVILPRILAISVETITGMKLREGGEEAIKNAQAKSSSLDEQLSSSVAAAADAPVNSTGISTSTNNGVGVQGWLNEYVSLPAGYKTTRRDALKFLSLGAALSSGFVAITRSQAKREASSLPRALLLPILVQLGIIAYVVTGWGYLSKSLSYVASPKALLKALFPSTLPTTTSGLSRVAAFKRFISDIEGRGGGEPVPEFPMGADWLNAPPLRLDRELRGKILILDFWTYCCINCIHMLPDLAFLESKFANEAVAIIGVHSAKFDNERNTEPIRSAVLRYDISHPVVNDRTMALWRALGVSSWPTLAVVSPAGRLLLSLSGEDHRADLDDVLTAAIEYYGERGLLDATPLPLTLEKTKNPLLAASPLRFPGKIALDSRQGRLFISDSGNHRILVTTLQGKFLTAFGGNGAGLLDGDAATAVFNRPQGVTYSSVRNCVYVCDTENHAVREIDLTSGQVRTLVGDGVRAQDDYRGGAAGTAQRLNSPWDCCLISSLTTSTSLEKESQENSNSTSGALATNNTTEEEEMLLVAMAGQHQLWSVGLDSGVAAAVSGTGAERNQNGATGGSTAWAQPSGVTFIPHPINQVLVADSESSSIRRLNLLTGGGAACIGGDPLFSDNLFKFGDLDGAGTSALLQHPLGVAAVGDTAWVVDSYNHKLKKINLADDTICAVAGSGIPGFADGPGLSTAQLSEPGGLAVVSEDGSQVFIADTNNSLIRVFDPETGSLSTLHFKDVPRI